LRLARMPGALRQKPPAGGQNLPSGEGLYASRREYICLAGRIDKTMTG